MPTTREAAYRLSGGLRLLGLTTWPYRNGSIVMRKDDREQAVMLRPTNKSGDGDHFWFWGWETDDEPRMDRGVELGRESELARRLDRVMSIPDLGGPKR